MFNTVYFFVALSGFFAIVTIVLNWQRQMSAKLIFKTIASICFVLCGVFSLSGRIFGTWQILIVAGLVFGLIGDIFLSVTVADAKDKRLFDTFGMIAFIAGHACYIFAFSLLTHSFNFYLLFAAAALPVTVIVMFVLKLFSGDILDKVSSTVYAAILGVMLAFALNVALSYNSKSFAILIAVGASLFVLSDVMKAFSLYSIKKTKVYDLFLSCYYAGQILIALSIGFMPF